MSSNSSRGRIGILGGTFDPVHLGHLIVSQEAAGLLKLDTVLFVPSGCPWQKAEREVTQASHRLNMVRQAIRYNPLFRLSTVDVDRPGPSYSADTITSLSERLGEGIELYFLCGSDSLIELPSWKEPNRLLRSCWLVACQRHGIGIPDLGALEQAVPGIAKRIVLLNTPLIDISSTAIRHRVAVGQSIRYLVPISVERYIMRHSLYTEQGD